MSLLECIANKANSYNHHKTIIKYTLLFYCDNSNYIFIGYAYT
jgi:hypothetical protein